LQALFMSLFEWRCLSLTFGAHFISMGIT